MAANITLGGAEAYIAVPEHLADVVLTEGYKSTRREYVPCNLDPRAGCEAMLRYHEEDRIVALEVTGVEDLLEAVGDVTRLKTKHLPPRNLGLGQILPPDPHVPAGGFECPTCMEIQETAAGIHVFYGADGSAFQACKSCSPSMMQDRQRSLDAGGKTILYHQTSEAAAKQIMASGGKMLRGSYGIAGAGIYFAQTPKMTEHKALSLGVVLECEVKLGNQKQLGRAADHTMTFKKLSQEGYHSVVVDRGEQGFPVPKVVNEVASGYEWIVYSWDQVKARRVVPRAA
jgi:hypothetical protein